jgi:predicted nucleic acid-binding protein
MRAALDTNLLIYAKGFWDEARVSVTRRLLNQLSEADLLVPLQLASWDALVLNVSAEGGARLPLTEDLHQGFSWRGVRVVNPLIEPQDSLLRQLLGG